MMLRRISRFMEIFWLVLAIGLTVATTYVSVTEGWAEGRRWILFPFIALAMFIFRKLTRKRLEAMDDRFRQQRGLQ
jgi:hypothetical protein